MSLLSRLENLLRRWAIPNLTGIIIAGQVVLYLAQTLRAAQGLPVDPFANLYLIPDKVLQGEVWRLVTFAFVPPNAGFLFAVISWMLFYFFGTALENQWGTVRYNLFLWLGVVANVAAAFLTLLNGPGHVASNIFLYSTVFLAFARLYPNFTINLFFILPIQIKWLALLMWFGLGYSFVKGDWMERVLILASVANYLVFFGKEHWSDLRSGHRRRAFQSRAKEATKALVHKCRVCGLDSDSSPKTLFRYCSKCAGQCCYCPEHIQNHEHVTEDGETAADPRMVDSSKA